MNNSQRYNILHSILLIKFEIDQWRSQDEKSGVGARPKIFLRERDRDREREKLFRGRGGGQLLHSINYFPFVSLPSAYVVLSSFLRRLSPCSIHLTRNTALLKIAIRTTLTPPLSL